MKKSEIWNTVHDLNKCIMYLSKCVSEDSYVLPIWESRCFSDIDKRVEELKCHIIDTDDYELGKKLAGFERHWLYHAVNGWRLNPTFAKVCHNMATSLLGIEIWLKEEQCSQNAKEIHNDPKKEAAISTTSHEWQHPNPPSEQEKKRSVGRPSKPFQDHLQNGHKDKLQALHDVMKGKIGKEAALVIHTAMLMGWITKPSFRTVENEFGDIGNRSGYNGFISGFNTFSEQEVEGMKRILLNSASSPKST